MAADERAVDADVLLATALAQAVRDVGRSLATEPRRVQGMVSDVLGAESRSRRAEIDAVVLAAEEGVPEDLLAGRTDIPSALARLRVRGLDEPLAAFAVEVWRYALGMLSDDAEPPSVTNSLERVHASSPANDDRVTDQVPDLQPRLKAPGAAPETVADLGQHQVSGQTFPPPSAPVGRPPVERQRRRKWAWIAVPVIGAMLIGGVVAIAQNADDGESDVAAATTSVESTTTSSTPETTTSVPAPPEVVFDVESTPVGDLTRAWSVANGELVGKLAFANATGADLTATYYEVIPKSVAATADAIASEPAATVIKADPVLAWEITVPAGKTLEVTYRTSIAADTTVEQLVQWKAQQLTDALAFTAERAAPPSLQVLTSSDTFISIPEADITGTTDPTATVTVNGVPATVNADGTWVAHVTGLGNPQNTLTTIATSRYDVTTTFLSNINYQVEASPDPGSTDTTTDTKPHPSGPTTTSPHNDPQPTDPVTPVTTTPPTTTPQPTIPPPTVKVTAPPSVTACRPVSFTATTTGATSGYWTTSWGYQSSAATLSTFVPDSASGSAWVRYTVSGPGGPNSDTAYFTVNPDPTTPGNDC